MRMNCINLVVGIAAALLPFAAPALAAGTANQTHFHETVAHDDLDLTTQEGVARLKARIETRVRMACRNGGRDGTSLRLERECREAALDRAGRQVRLVVAEANADSVRLAETRSASRTDTPGA